MVLLIRRRRSVLMLLLGLVECTGGVFCGGRCGWWVAVGGCATSKYEGLVFSVLGGEGRRGDDGRLVGL